MTEKDGMPMYTLVLVVMLIITLLIIAVQAGATEMSVETVKYHGGMCEVCGLSMSGVYNG